MQSPYITRSGTPLNLDYLLPENEPNLRLPKVAEKLGMSFKFVWKLYEQGILYGHDHHSSRDALQALAKPASYNYRYTRTATRESILTYLCSTASYDDEMKLQCIQQVANTLPRERLLELAKTCEKKAKTY